MCNHRESLSSEEHERVEWTVSKLLDLLGKAHAMAILREFTFSDEPLQFSDFEEQLGVSPNTLSERLKELVGAGLLVRESYDEVALLKSYHSDTIPGETVEC